MEGLEKYKQELIHDYKREAILSLLLSIFVGGMIFFHVPSRSDKLLWFFLIMSIIGLIFSLYKRSDLECRKITKDEIKSALVQVKKGLVARSALGGLFVGMAYAYWMSFKTLGIVTIDAYIPLIAFVVIGAIVILTNYFSVSSE